MAVRSCHLVQNRRYSAVLVALSALLIASCSSRGNQPSGADVTTSLTTTNGAASTSTVAGSIAEPVDPSDREAIVKSFEVFFGGQQTTVDQKVAVLQDGERYREMLTAASANAQFQQITTTIRDIRAATAAECREFGTEPPCAVVTHDLLVGGFPMAAAIQSPAVLSDHQWMVGSSAWCKVVAIGGASCD